MSLPSYLAWAVVALVSLSSARAFALPDEGAWRVFLDTNVAAVDWVRTMHNGDAPARQSTVVSLGPSQLSASRLWVPTTPLGFGAGYLLKRSWMIDLRAGLGFDLVASKDDAGTPTYVAWSFMPGLSWLPQRYDGKLFLKFSPVLDFVQYKQGGTRQRYFGGCYSVGAGTFLFTGEHASFDLGAFFEGRFPEFDKTDSAKVRYADLRWVIRIGLSLWR